MPVTVKLSFPSGRYHATPWGRHVNEGVAEWPPSPWRLLRALIAAWKRTCPEQFGEDQIRAALAQLLEPPTFYLPSHRTAHTRHYMPWEKKGPLDRTLIFDAFVAVNDPVLINWDNAELSSEQEDTLQKLLINLGTLGRAESWVNAELTQETKDWNCVPADSADEPFMDSEPTYVYCADPSTALSSDYYPIHDPKKLRKGLKPNDRLMDCPPWHLCLDTQTIHAKRWPQTPGAQWVAYRTRAVQKATVAPRRQVVKIETPTVARFLLDADVLPLTKETLRVAESFRRAAQSQFGYWCHDHPEQSEEFRRINDPSRFASPTLSGRNLEGSVATGHGHAYYLPTAEGTDPRSLTHVTVFARGGLGAAEIAALRRIQRIKLGDSENVSFVQVRMTNFGQPGDWPSHLFGNVGEAASDTWISRTPFVGPAHIGCLNRSRYLRKALSRDWRRHADEVAAWRGVDLIEVEELDAGHQRLIGQVKAHEFRRQRSKHHGDWRACAMFRLKFSRPVQGPISLGYASHFGMGLFTPDKA